MKFFKTLKSKLLILLLIIIACMTSISYAQSQIQPRVSGNENEDDYGIMPISEGLETSTNNLNVAEKDLFLLEDDVIIDYPVSGNIFAIAKNITISNEIDGNIFILAQTADIESSAYIYGSLFVCADTVNVNGNVHDIYSASSKLVISSTASIFRDLTAVTDSLNLNGIVSRNANLTFDTIDIDESHALIGGDLTYSSKSASIPDSIVSGKVNYNKLDDIDVVKPTISTIIKGYIKSIIMLLVISLIVILILVFAAPKFAEREYQILKNKPAQALGYGALALVVIPIICFILVCTIIGIIPAIIILLLYILLFKIASAIVAIPLGKMICKKINKESNGMLLLMSILIVIAIFILEKLPVLGAFVSLAVSIYGFGIIVYAMFHAKAEIKDKNIVAEASAIVEPQKDEPSKKEKDSENKSNINDSTE